MKQLAEKQRICCKQMLLHTAPLTTVSVVELTVGFTGSTSTDETMKFGLMERGITTGMMGATVSGNDVSYYIQDYITVEELHEDLKKMIDLLDREDYLHQQTREMITIWRVVV